MRRRRSGNCRRASVRFRRQSEDLKAALTDFTYRKSWRQFADPGDFETVEEWLAWAAGPHGGKASISRHITAEELDRLGTQIGAVLLDTVRAGAPLIEYCYHPDNAHLRLAELADQFCTETVPASTPTTLVGFLGHPGHGPALASRVGPPPLDLPEPDGRPPVSAEVAALV